MATPPSRPRSPLSRHVPAAELPASVAAAHLEGRLSARPRSSEHVSEHAPEQRLAGSCGSRRLGRSGGRDAWLHVPRSYRAPQPAALLVVLHGAGARAEAALQVARPFVEETGAIALAIDSLGVTWDVIVDKLGPDVAFLDAALERTFSEYAVDRSCIGVSGFSDGASYALTLGLANGDLFDGVVAFSPGFAAPVVKRENVRIFISHGTRDAVLPIESCSRRLVPILKALGHDVTYREFDGPHTVPPEVAREAMAWLAAPSRSA